ncbi:MAG TPA: methyltransferase domain-containing protein [Gaiellaceae bacterium]|nr:methyltransferase domain-containing protein [Gaiellaceae bacterium]
MPESELFQGADAYERFMGRYSRLLAHELARFAGVEPGDRVLDVGCGTGALTRVLAEIVGADKVAGTDPSAPFVEACRTDVPGADIRVGPAEALPFPDGAFDCALAQLVFSFVSDQAAAVREMARVTRPGGRVAACVWDFTGGMKLIRSYWDAAHEVDPDAPDEKGRFGGQPGELAALWREAGLRDVVDDSLTVASGYEDFEELWQTFLGGVGPVGVHAVSLGDAQRAAVREALWRRVGSPDGSFSLPARAWAVVGVV